ncbi:hypothetical protein M0R45_006561 [Rubus argutus]|uniref:Secreted protein n=1 Tax=Rubus argutus TaxID=59490 RepID=A0AAW1YRI4_RUBAR
MRAPAGCGLFLIALEAELIWVSTWVAGRAAVIDGWASRLRYGVWVEVTVAGFDLSPWRSWWFGGMKAQGDKGSTGSGRQREHGHSGTEEEEHGWVLCFCGLVYGLDGDDSSIAEDVCLRS